MNNVNLIFKEQIFVLNKKCVIFNLTNRDIGVVLNNVMESRAQNIIK